LVDLYYLVNMRAGRRRACSRAALIIYVGAALSEKETHAMNVQLTLVALGLV